MARRHNAEIQLKLYIWKKVDNRYYVEPDDLFAAIADGGTDEAERKKRMGVGYKYIQELIDGALFDAQTISFVEHGIRRHEEVPRPTHSYPAIDHFKK